MVVTFLPHDRCLVVCDEVFVGFREVAASEEAVRGGEGGGMGAFQNQVAGRIGHDALLLGVVAPQHVHDLLLVGGDGADHGVREGFPSLAGMRGGAVGTDGQHRVEQQHPLFGPAVEIAAGGNGGSRVVVNLLEDVAERGRKGNPVVHREAEAVGLPVAVVGVLSDDDHLQGVERAFVEGAEDVAAAREDALRGIFLPHEGGEVVEVGLVEFGSQNRLPVRCDFYVHVRYAQKRVCYSVVHTPTVSPHAKVCRQTAAGAPGEGIVPLIRPFVRSVAVIRRSSRSEAPGRPASL